MTVVTGEQADVSPPSERGGRSDGPVGDGAAATADALTRLRKIEGQVQGLQRMIDAGRPCPDVVVQVGSATRALQEVAVGLLDHHLRRCVVDGGCATPDEAGRRLDELATVIRQVVRL